MHRLKQRNYDIPVDIDQEHIVKMDKVLDSSSMPKEKSIIESTVSSITKDYVWVNIGIKSEGKIPINEFKINGFGRVPEIGDSVEVWIEKHEDQNGSLIVSHSQVNRIRSWKELEEVFQTKQLIEGTITKKVRGGFMVTLLPWGVEAFLPSSQMEFRSMAGKSSNILQVMANKKLPFFIIRMERRWNIIVSRKIDPTSSEPQSQPKFKNQEFKNNNQDKS